MGKTVPEKRLDKNGVLTTKHVKVAPKSDGKRTPLPKVDDTEARALRVFDAIRNRRGKISEFLVREVQREAERRMISIPDVSRTILTLHPKTLDRLEGPSDYSMVMEISESIGVGIRERSFTRLNNLAVLRPDLGQLNDPNVAWLVGGLNAHRGRSEWLDYSDATENDLAVPRAVLKATVELGADFVETDKAAMSPIKYIRSEDLVDLIEERPQDVDRIIAIVNERKPVLDEAGVNGVEGLLDSGTHGAVLNGAL